MTYSEFMSSAMNDVCGVALYPHVADSNFIVTTKTGNELETTKRKTKLTLIYEIKGKLFTDSLNKLS